MQHCIAVSLQSRDINHIEQVVSKCIVKECSDINQCHEFNINTVRDDIKKLDVLMGELKNSINSSAKLNLNAESPDIIEHEPKPAVMVNIINPTKHIQYRRL